MSTFVALLEPKETQEFVSNFLELPIAKKSNMNVSMLGEKVQISISSDTQGEGSLEDVFTIGMLHEWGWDEYFRKAKIENK